MNTPLPTAEVLATGCIQRPSGSHCRRIASKGTGRKQIMEELNKESLSKFIKERAHLKPKHWPTVKVGLDILRGIIGEPGTQLFDSLFPRVLTGGKWHKAAEYARMKDSQHKKPWVVLIMGCNGIRKATSVFQSWLSQRWHFL